MKIVLLALNAKFIHPSLALRYIKSYCSEYSSQISILESTINNDENELIKEIYNSSPDILGISCYIWNMNMVKTLIPTIKKILPNTTIVLGGPEVSYDGETLLNTLDVDIIMQGEGEQTWMEYLNYYINSDISLENIDGIIYKDNGQIKKNNSRRPLDLKTLPFVYDTFDGLEHKIIYYEASRGCPFNCQYCLSSIEKGVRFVPIENVKNHISFFLSNNVKQVKFVDRTFNTNKKYATEIWKHIILNDNGYTNFHFEIAAELIDDSMIAELSGARKGLIQFEIGVQSTNPKVLNAISRNMPYEDIKSITTKIKKLGTIHQHLDLIAGLPFEDYLSFGNSFNQVIALRPEQFQLGFLKLLKGSGLRENASKYGLVYKSEPPYEILYTNHLSFKEMIKLHMIEELTERYYNTNRFINSLEYLFISFNSPFEFFEQLALYWESNMLDKVQHNKLAYYKHLINFGETISNVNSSLLKEYLRLDFVLHENPKEIPEFMKTLLVDDSKYYYNILLKDDEFININLPHLSHSSPRSRNKITHLECFNYNVWENYVINDYNNNVVLKTPVSVLLDYTSSPPRGVVIKMEEK